MDCEAICKHTNGIAKLFAKHERDYKYESGNLKITATVTVQQRPVHYNGWVMIDTVIDARVTMQGVVRHGRNMTLAVMLGDHAAGRRLITPKVIIVLVLSP